jgi:NAD(P)-dependent dehydrogenase (short-subunit alcohol dehydrogenase family)
MSLRVFVTGASRGIGLEFVEQYLADGARVFAAARELLDGEVVRLAQQHPGQLSLVRLDVTNEQDLANAVAAVRAQVGGLDVLINNAGINARGVGLGAYKRELMLQVLHTNAVAPVLIGQAFVELLGRGTTPRIVNISSQVGAFAWNKTGTSPLYAASKAALNMYTRALAREAAGIITIAVHPGWVQTSMGGKEAPLTPAQSVKQLRTLIARLGPADNGQFFNYDGTPHPD